MFSRSTDQSLGREVPAVRHFDPSLRPPRPVTVGLGQQGMGALQITPAWPVDFPFSKPRPETREGAEDPEPLAHLQAFLQQIQATHSHVECEGIFQGRQVMSKN